MGTFDFSGTGVSWLSVNDIIDWETTFFSGAFLTKLPNLVDYFLTVSKDSIAFFIGGADFFSSWGGFYSFMCLLSMWLLSWSSLVNFLPHLPYGQTSPSSFFSFWKEALIYSDSSSFCVRNPLLDLKLAAFSFFACIFPSLLAIAIRCSLSSSSSYFLMRSASSSESSEI